jgi:hypothetical protein
MIQGKPIVPPSPPSPSTRAAKVTQPSVKDPKGANVTKKMVKAPAVAKKTPVKK